MYVGQGLFLDWLDYEIFCALDRDMTSTFVHNIKKHQHLAQFKGQIPVWLFHLVLVTEQ